MVNSLLMHCLPRSFHRQMHHRDGDGTVRIRKRSSKEFLTTIENIQNTPHFLSPECGFLCDGCVYLRATATEVVTVGVVVVDVSGTVEVVGDWAMEGVAGVGGEKRTTTNCWYSELAVGLLCIDAVLPCKSDHQKFLLLLKYMASIFLLT